MGAKKDKVVEEVKEVTRKRVMPPKDPELEAIARCTRILSGLTSRAKARVLDYLRERVEPELAGGVGRGVGAVIPEPLKHERDREFA